MTKERSLGKDSASSSADERTGLSKALSLYSTYGWRGRIGLVSPSTNTTLEPEFWRLAPDGVSIHVARVYQAGPQEPSTYRRMADDIATAATLLATAEVDVIAFGCTSCTYFVPPEEIRATMAEKAHCPTVLTADAVVDALRALNVRRVALASPRTEFVTKRELDFLASSGFEVVSSRSLGLGATEEERRYIGRVPSETLYRLVASVVRPEADAIFVTCTQLPTLPMIARLEAEFGKPVVTSNQATVWRCLRHIGFTAPIRGYGRLLDTHMLPGA
jgi:arylmalonate decarboxylase